MRLKRRVDPVPRREGRRGGELHERGREGREKGRRMKEENEDCGEREREGGEWASAVERREGRNKRGEEREWNGWDRRRLVVGRKEAILS